MHRFDQHKNWLQEQANVDKFSSLKQKNNKTIYKLRCLIFLNSRNKK